MDSEDSYVDYEKFCGILHTTADSKYKELSYCLFRTEFCYFGTDQDICLPRSNATSIREEGEGKKEEGGSMNIS
jgi:hypothetical protein